MTYYINRVLSGASFDQAVDRITDALHDEGFGVLTEIDVKETLKKKLDVDFRPYRILGACNPNMARQALETEDKIGTMLPCNVIVQQTNEGPEIAAIDPVASMSAVGNPDLAAIARDVREMLKRAVEAA